MWPASARTRVCAACGVALPSAVEVCGSCGSPAREPERRIVTVLFADLSNYTRLCEDLDPEDVHLLVRPLMNALRGVCQTVGGDVAVIEGDGFMAVFGALASDEDDPRRAVSAAVMMQELVASRRLEAGNKVPPLRVGINIGEVVVAPSWERAGFSVSGDPINVASRLCGVAEEGGVLCASVVAQLVPTLPSWGSDVAYQVKNRDEPVTARALDWEGARGAALVRRIPSSARLVGREPLLDSALAVLKEHGSLQLRGDAGIGKSRILHALGARLEGPVLHALCARFPQRSIGEQLLSELAPHLDNAQLSAREAICLAVASGKRVETTEPITETDIAEALRAILARQATVSGVGLLVDDAQWAGPEDAALLASLRQEPVHGVRLVMAVRADGPAEWDETVLDVPGLDLGSTAELIRALLPGAAEALVAFLAQRCGGVPLMVEQCVSLLVEEGALELGELGWDVTDRDRLRALPTAMRLFVSSRIDLVPEAAREALGVASVCGDVVDARLLVHLMGRPAIDQQLTDLVARGLLVWRDIGDELRLEFRHAFVREVAYERLLRRRRQQLHLMAADWYGVLPAVTVLAEEAAHLESAIALGADDCQVVRRAVAILVQYARGTTEERLLSASDALSRAQAISENHPQCDVDRLFLTLAQAEVLEAQGDEAGAAERASTALGLCPREDQSTRARCHLARGRALIFLSPSEAAQDLDTAQSIYDELDDLSGTARVHIERSKLGEVELSQRWQAMELAYNAALRSGDVRLASLAAQDLATHLHRRDPGEATRWDATARELLRQDDVVGRARLDQGVALGALDRYDLVNMADLSRIALASSKDSGATQLVLNGLLTAIASTIETGSLVEARELIDEATEMAVRRPTRRMAVDVEMHRALLLSRQGKGREARDLLDALQQQAQGLGREFARQHCAMRGRVLLETGWFPESRDDFAQAIVLGDELEQGQVALVDRLFHMIARVCAREHIYLREGSELRHGARSSTSPVIGEMTAWWLVEHDILQGHIGRGDDWSVAINVPMTAAVALEAQALQTRRPDLLLQARQAWSVLGSTVWEARSLLWHEELTGMSHREADDILASLDAPTGLAETFRSQVRDLRR